MKWRLLALLIVLWAITSNAQIISSDSTIKGRNIEYFDSNLTPSDKALGGNIFLGKGFLGRNFSEYFSNPFFVGINIDIIRKKLIIQIDDYIGFGKTRKSLLFPEQKEWAAKKGAFHFLIGGNLGYTLVDTKNFKWVPLAGIGGNIFTSSVLSSSENSKNEPFLLFYKIGFFIDFKSLTLLQKHIRINDTDHNYTSLRLSAGYNGSIGKPKYPEFYQGSMIYIILGMRGLSRDYFD